MLYSTQCFQFLIIRQQSPGSSRLIKEYLLRIWLKWLKKSSLQSALAFQRTPTEWMMLKCAQADCNIREHRFLHLMGTEIQWWRSTNKRLHVKQRTGKVIDLKCSPCVAVHLKEIEVETLDTQTNKKFKSTRHAYRSSEDLVSRGPGHQRTRSSRTSIWRPSTRAPFIRPEKSVKEKDREWTQNKNTLGESTTVTLYI